MAQIQQTKQPQQPKFAVSQEKPYQIFNLTFASKKIFTDFITASLLIVVIPIVSVLVLNAWVKNDPNISELMKVVISVTPALIFINIVACTYAVRAMKDPENYKKDPPLVIKMKKN